MRLQDFLAERLVGTDAEIDFNPEIGQTVFVGFMPAKVKEGLLFAANQTLNRNNYTGMYAGATQILFRSNNPAKSSRVMRQVTAALSGFEFGDLETDSVRIVEFLARHEPLVYPKQESGLYEASVNFDVVCSFKGEY
ncbi:hypothetical protein VCR15J2_390007 [Vibrio coralliirubri]|uniref:minor capsid protein n=1 Tax=Vibrio coralliirubri TaxID=1516159 RepID=UPI000631910E|nr:minor capsid protein [Vibrio coralliirubri]CDT52565.1 hypothetical protein VCR15J2_390007 [Vibrio coralliirubri]